jgi:Trp operon repressor
MNNKVYHMVFKWAKNEIKEWEKFIKLLKKEYDKDIKKQKRNI